MTWSAGIIAMVAPGSRAAILAVASATHGAVSRASGSTITCAAGKSGSSAGSCAACAALVTIHVCSTSQTPRSRAMVAAISVSPSASGRNCLGRPARLAGQKRVPEPPAMTTACRVDIG